MSLATSSTHGHAGEFDEARALVVAQRWQEALPILNRLHEEEPESATIGQELAQVLLRLNRREEALGLLRDYKLNKAAEIASKTFLSKEGFRFFQQGLDWLAKGAYSQACDRFELAMERDQAHSDILFRLSQCEVLDGNADLALKLLDQMERIHGKTTDSQLWRARALAQRGQRDEALRIYSSLHSGNRPAEPSAEWLALWWAEALQASGKRGEALAVLENDVKRTPGHLQTNLAWLQLRFQRAESPNQFLALRQELDRWEKSLAERGQAIRKREAEFVLDLFDAAALQRAATSLRVEIQTKLPLPSPKISGTPTPASST